MTSVPKEPRRRPLPEAYEFAYWRNRLLDRMAMSDRFRSRLEDLKADLEGHNPYAGDGDADTIELEIAQSFWQSFLDGRLLRVEDFSLEGIQLMDTAFPEAMFGFLQEFGLTRGGPPAFWAIQPVFNMVLNRPDLNHLDLVYNSSFEMFFERWIHLHVNPAGGSVTTFHALNTILPPNTHPDISVDVNAGEPMRFDEWDELTRSAQHAATEAVAQLKRKYHESYPPRRNPSSWSRRERVAENLAYHLTGRAHGELHRNTRRAFCALIGLDNPAAP